LPPLDSEGQKLALGEGEEELAMPELGRIVRGLYPSMLR